jgi:hypothetical protein
MKNTGHLHATVAIALLAGALATTACSSPHRYVNPNADVSAMRAVAVLPFQNASGNGLAADRVQRVFQTELVALGQFDVIEPGQVFRVLRKENVDPNALTPDDLKRIAKALGADGLFLGTVVEFDDGRGSVPAPQITLQLRLVEGGSAATLWSVSRTSSGANWTARLFGVGGQSGTAVAEALIREELKVFSR